MSNEQRLEEEIARLQELLGTQAITTNNAAATNNVPDGPMAVNKIGIKVGPFWKRDPILWFAQIEAQFTLAGIIREDTRYYHVLAGIDSEILACCSDIIRDPPADDKYTKIKERIIQEYSTSEQNRMQQLLRGCELGDRKPSQLLREMRDLARDVITDEKIIKSLWMQQLPETTQAVLKVSETTLQLSQLAEQADKLADITRNRVASSVTASPDSTNEIGLAELRTRISEISNKLAAFRQERSRSRNRSFNREQSFRSGSREYHPYCYYHRKFGANAKNCREPCQFKSKN
ncbi:uncharacterized protein LOC129774274 [Toxorhynchites rutilus septentrionalis]|uniref:uncharacterized protein LOC129774274 n=1 Tax=Toxorhynchites rutilus septentrionalis TaxID=329112 RepID=UPI0024783A86|nr:uncharacterized protein LOC129774274 [Toxorhynchites rutilus septentrionalis]